MEKQSTTAVESCCSNEAGTHPDGGDSTHTEGTGSSACPSGDNLSPFTEPDNPPPHGHHSITSSEADAVGDDAAAMLSISSAKLDYKPPCWAVEPSADYHYGIDVIKNGTLVQSIDFAQRHASTFVVIGRLPTCDIQLDHPSISRYHCIMQYGEDIMDRTGRGWHIYDLGSTHGTKLNKRLLPSKQYIRIRVGYVMQFGGSSRIMVLKGPSSDIEEEWEYSPTEMRTLKERQKLEDKLRKEAKKDVSAEKINTEEGISWGIEYDEEQAYAHATEGDLNEDREAAYRDDPLKVLSHFFDREGFDMEFTFSESGAGHTHKWTCHIELPVDTAAGQSLSASATCSGSKKEAQTICALNACRTLDMHGVLYRSKNEARKKAKILIDNDFYDSDEDTYFDRTGQIEKSRESRRKRAMQARGESSEVKETYQSLLKKIDTASKEMQHIEKRLEGLSNRRDDVKVDEADDELDAFCRHLEETNSAMDNIETKAEKSHLRQRLVELKHEIERMEKLAKIAKPVALPALKVTTSNTTGSSDVKRAASTVSAATMKKLMMIRRSKAAEMREKERERQVGMELPPSMAETPFVAEIEEDDEPMHSTSTVITNSSDSKLQPSDLEEQAPAHEPQPSERNSETLDIEPGASARKMQLKKPSPQAVDAAIKETGDEQGCTDQKMTQEEETDRPNVSEGHLGEEPSDLGRVIKRRRTRVREARTSAKASTQAGEYGEGCANRDEEYATWMPPEDQRGDGTTALNAKFAGRY